MPKFITLSDVYENIVNGGGQQPSPEDFIETLEEAYTPSTTIRWRGGNSEAFVDLKIGSSDLEDSDRYEEVMQSIASSQEKDLTPLKELIIEAFREAVQLSVDDRFGMELRVDLSVLTFDEHVTFYRNTLEGLVDDYVEKKREEKELEEEDDIPGFEGTSSQLKNLGIR